MIHGYGAYGAVFYRMIQHLRKYFRITTIDMLGMGASGRPTFTLTKAEQCIEFFMISFEAWMQATKYKAEGDFILAGHSLGGYLSTQYVLKHPENITKLILISSVGIQKKPEDFSFERVVNA